MGYKKMLFAGLTAWMSLSSFAFDLKTESPVVIKGDTTQMAPVAKTALKMLQGDIKKVLGSEMKFQILDMAWNMNRIYPGDSADKDLLPNNDWLAQHEMNFWTREFGKQLAEMMLPVMQESYRLAYIRKPEFLGNTRCEERDKKYSIISDLPWSELYINARLADYNELADESERIEKMLNKAIAKAICLRSERMSSTHPVDNKLRFALSLDGGNPVVKEYQTKGRSEQWKVNTLQSQARVRIQLPIAKLKKHLLSIKALDDGMVLDQLYLY